MNPKLAVAIGRNLEAFDGDALDAGFFRFDEDGVGAGCDPQYLETQGRHGCALRQHHHRYPPDNSVALGLDREQATPGSRFFKNMNVAQQSGKIEQERLGRLAEHRQPRHRKRVVEFRKDIGQSGFAQHHAGVPHRIGKNLIVARKCTQFRSSFLVEVANGIGRHVRIEPVRL